MMRVLSNSLFAFVVGLIILFFYFKQRTEIPEELKPTTTAVNVNEVASSPLPVATPIAARVDSFEVRVGTKSSGFGPFSVTGITGKKEEKQTVVFSDGTSLPYFGFSAKYVGAIWNNKGGALLALRHDDCAGCKKTTRTLVIHVPGSKNAELLYPGNRGSLSMKNSTIVSNENIIRAFIGNCISTPEVVLVWISSKDPDAKVFSLAADNALRITRENASDVLQNIQPKIVNRKCIEIPSDEAVK